MLQCAPVPYSTFVFRKLKLKAQKMFSDIENTLAAELDERSFEIGKCNFDERFKSCLTIATAVLRRGGLRSFGTF